MFTVIGDVHGRYNEYLDIVSRHEYTLQLGDMGFDYGPISHLNEAKHQFFGGNHENYDSLLRHHIRRIRLDIGDGGPHILNDTPFFFVRGAFSIDYHYRLDRLAKTGVKSWWPQEELPIVDMYNLELFYLREKPEIMITHTAPAQITEAVGGPSVLKSFGWNPKTFASRTSVFLQRLWDQHKPKLWIFGHMHKSWDKNVEGTRFICLDILEDLYLGDVL